MLLCVENLWISLGNSSWLGHALIKHIPVTVLVVFLACIVLGAHCGYHWFVCALATVQSYKLREVIQERIAHSPDGFREASNVSLEGRLCYERPCLWCWKFLGLQGQNFEWHTPYYLCFTGNFMTKHWSPLLTFYADKAWLWSLADLGLDLDHDLYKLIYA